MRAARRHPAAVAAAFVLALAVTGGCSDDGEGADVPAGGEEAAAAAGASTSTTTAAAAPDVADERPYEVERIELVVEDETRPTAADPARGLPERASRTMPTLVLVPEGDGPFPVLVFSHGHTATGETYEPFLSDIAAAGYVVAAPTFPLSSGEDGSVADYVNQPGDVYAVLDELLERSSEPGDPLEGRVDGEHIALGGHSLGAITTIGAVYNSCCADPDVNAAVVLSGVEAPFPDGSYADRPDVPLLLAHGGEDDTVPVESSDALFAAATGPAVFVRFPAGQHSDILGGEAGEVLTEAIVAWLDRWLLDDAGALDRLTAAVDASSVATVESRP